MMKPMMVASRIETTPASMVLSMPATITRVMVELRSSGMTDIATGKPAILFKKS